MAIHISSILPTDFPSREYLGEYLYWPVTEYIDHWERVLSEGGRVPQLFRRVLRLALEHTGNPDTFNSAEGDCVHPIVPDSELYNIEITDLLYHFGEKRDSISINRLRTGGIRSLGELMECTSSQLKLIPYIGISTLQRAMIYREWLSHEWPTIVADYRASMEEHVFPRGYDSGEALIKSIRRALVEISTILYSRSDNPRHVRSPRDRSGMRLISAILKERYVDGLSFGAIAERQGKTSWHITKSHVDFVGMLTRGEVINRNLRLHPDLVSRLQRAAETSLFGSAEVLGSSDSNDVTLLSAMGIVTMNVCPDFDIVIPSREKCRYSLKLRQVFRVLRDTVVPMSREEYLRRLSGQSEFGGKLDCHDQRFVDTILSDRRVTESTSDGSVKVRMEFFISDEQRVGRVIYDSHRWLTRSQLMEEFRRRMGRESNSVNLSNLRKYGIHSSGDLWACGQKKRPVNHFITDYCREHRIFYMHELEAALKEEGYPILHRVRGYVTLSCLVDNLDANHFCHKDYAQDYPEYSWRRSGRSGLANWILRQVRDVLSEHGTTQIDTLIGIIEMRAREEGKENYIRQRIKSTLSSYTGPEHPFLAVGDCIMENREVIGTVNFATLGRRGHHRTSQFERIRHLAVKSLEESSSGCISLVSFLRQLNDSHGENVSRNNCMRALTNTRLAPIPVELRNIDGALMLQLRPFPAKNAHAGGE